VEIGTLELISSRNFTIRSLGISYERDEDITPLTISSFRNLNLSELQKLAFWEMSWDNCKDIMDLALQSTCRGMTLMIDYGLPNLDLLKHRLLDQVINVRIAIRQ
jgi:SAM-dependent MidA family methyltransferase